MAPGSTRNPWPATLIALAFIALVGLILWAALPDVSDVDAFLKIWAGVGSLVGVVTGAIPAFFFKSEADNAKGQASVAQERAERSEAAAREAVSDRAEAIESVSTTQAEAAELRKSLRRAELALDATKTQLDEQIDENLAVKQQIQSEWLRTLQLAHDAAAGVSRARFAMDSDVESDTLRTALDDAMTALAGLTAQAR